MHVGVTSQTDFASGETAYSSVNKGMEPSSVTLNTHEPKAKSKWYLVTTSLWQILFVFSPCSRSLIMLLSPSWPIFSSCPFFFFFSPHLLLELSPGTYSTLARRQAHCQRRGSDPLNCSTELGPLTLGGRSDQTEPRGGNPQLPQLYKRHAQHTSPRGSHVSEENECVLEPVLWTRIPHGY